MDSTLSAKAERFIELHRTPGAFLIANAWDVASARILEGLGYPALATSSGAAAAILGRRDGQVTRDEALGQAAAMAAATTVPFAGDLENGFGHAPEDAALTIRRAAEAGLVGGSIEDATNDPVRPIYDFNHAVERVAAAVEAAHALPIPFTLTARAENFLNERPDLDDTLRRLQAFERAGADVLFAPGLPDLAAVRTVCTAVSKPVNFMVGIRGASFTVAELADAGVRRISLSTSFFRAAMSGLIAAAREAHDQGTFTYLERILLTGEIHQVMQTP
jgi:2-methylisocitrate lyase-like PEP mutase family enzyme